MKDNELMSNYLASGIEISKVKVLNLYVFLFSWRSGQEPT